MAEHRAELLARIGTLSNSDCDALVLQFQLIPRDEILNPLSEPRKDLLHYVKGITSDEDLKDLERAIKERRRPSPEELDAINRAKKDRGQ